MYLGGHLLGDGECLQEPLLQSQPHPDGLGAADLGPARRPGLRDVSQPQPASPADHVGHQLPRHAPVRVLLALAHPREALEALAGEDAAHDEVAVAHVQLPVDRQADLPLQVGGELHTLLSGVSSLGLRLAHHNTGNIVCCCLCCGWIWNDWKITCNKSRMVKLIFSVTPNTPVRGLEAGLRRFFFDAMMLVSSLPGIVMWAVNNNY